MENLYEVTSQLFKVSCHRARIEILKALEEGDRSAKDLSELLDASETYAHKHLHRLREEGLIRKDGKNFALSSSGMIFINSLDGIEVVGRYKSLWESHSIENVPGDLLKEMRVFNGTELIRSAPRVLEKISSATSVSSERLLFSTDRMPRLLGTSPRDMVKDLLKVGGEGFWLIGPVPHFLSKHPNLRLPLGLEVRIAPMDNIYMGILVIDDKEACVIFPDEKGSLDWDYAIYGTDPDFISWAEKSFWNMYEKGEDIRTVKL
ncbi:MAG: ArsR family transcriptional regulator [Halobacteriota archaeon]|nr:ArsR family transcriptional regulator [Halobacteriota archaeon]